MLKIKYPLYIKYKMPNAWVTFHKKYAQENNISYGCAIAQAGPAYRKMKAEQNQKKQVTIRVKKQKNNEN